MSTVLSMESLQQQHSSFCCTRLNALFKHLIEPFCLKCTLFLSPPLSAITPKCVVENRAMFSEPLVGVRDASCRTSDLYTDLMEKEGGDSAVTEAQTVEKKPSCVHDPDD